MVKPGTFSSLFSHFRDYLFKSTDSSVAIRASVRGEYHIAVPLRDLSGQALGVFDIGIGHYQKLPPHEHKDLQKMLKTAQAACSEILKLSLEETEPAYVLGIAHTEPRQGVLGAKLAISVKLHRKDHSYKYERLWYSHTSPEQAKVLSGVPQNVSVLIWITGYFVPKSH